MKWKSTALLLVTTIGIGTYISLYEIKQPSPEEREHLSKQILNLKPESLTQIVLDMPQAKVTLAHTAAGWKLTPANIRAEETRVSQITAALSPLAAQRILTGTKERPLNPKDYGLDPAVGWLSLVTDAAPTTLQFGDKTAVDNNRYLRVANRPEIFIIPSALFDAVNVTADTFRDHALIQVNSWMTDKIRIHSAGSTRLLERRENAWYLVEPVADRADRTQITGVLDGLGRIPIVRFVDDAPQVEHLADWGFEAPYAEIRLSGAEMPEPITLFIGKPLPDDGSLRYAKRSDEPPLYAISAKQLEPVLQDPNTWRAKTCFEFFTASVTRVELVHEGKTLVLERKDLPAVGQQPADPGPTRAGAGTQWQVAGTNIVLDTAKVETLLSRFADLRLSGFVEDAPTDLARYGLAQPQGTIAMWSSGAQEPQRMTIGGTIDQTTEHYGRIDGRSAIVKLPALVTELLGTTADSLTQVSDTKAVSDTAATSSARR